MSEQRYEIEYKTSSHSNEEWKYLTVIYASSDEEAAEIAKDYVSHDYYSIRVIVEKEVFHKK